MSYRELLNAIQLNQVDKCEELMEMGAKPFENPEDFYGILTPIQFAKLHGNKLIIDVLERDYRSQNLKLDKNYSRELGYACKLNDISYLEMVLEKGANLNISNKQIKSNGCLVHVCLGCLQYDCVKLLLKYGADPNVLDEDGNTPLNRLLLPTVYNSRGSLKRNPSCLMDQLLTWYFCDDNDQITSLGQVLVKKLRIKFVKLLLKYGARYDIPGGDNNTAFLNAAFNNNNKEIVYLFRKDMKKKTKLNRELLVTAHEFDAGSLLHRDYLCRDLFRIIFGYI